MRTLNLMLCLLFIFLLAACQSNNKEKSMIEKSSFGKLENGTEADLYTLTSKSGASAKITNYGAAIVSLMMPDKKGKFEDIVLGYDNPQDYAKGTSYFGAIVGRYGNRIGKGKFSIDGTEYKLAVNNGENHLHGGNIGYNKVMWNAEPVETENEIGRAHV